MREDYVSYINRIHQLIHDRACFPPACTQFMTAPGVKKKFYNDGSFRSFYGDTIVFGLSEDAKRDIYDIQASLYDVAGAMLAQELPKNTLHITLHDLSAAAQLGEVEPVIQQHKAQLEGKLTELKNQGWIDLKARGIVSMVSSSLVMLFEPADEKAHDVIQDMYQSIDDMCPLSYPLTLHSTLAYYKPGVYPAEQWNALYRFVCDWNTRYAGQMDLTLDSRMVEHQIFCSMWEYFPVR